MKNPLRALTTLGVTAVCLAAAVAIFIVLVAVSVLSGGERVGYNYRTPTIEAAELTPLETVWGEFRTEEEREKILNYRG
ncbi:MAG: hypothetical protein LBQ47_07650 [Endomicrobium sp.]|jgi:hypothetical protein|nr:hypothetical protein [Endomicrobium sp.]